MISIELREHQKKAVGQLENGKILWGGVGSGKTLTACAYYMEKEAPRDIYVITTAKKRDDRDWETEFAQFGVGTEKGATVAGVLTVDSWNNIMKYSNVYGAFFIFDEQRLVGSGRWVKAFLKIAKRNHWILLSATPGDTWLDYVPVFVANGFYKNRTEFMREHVVFVPHVAFPKVQRYTSVGRLVRLRNKLLVEMPYDRHTVRHPKIVDVPYDKSTFDKVLKERWNVYEDRPIKDVAELFRVMRRVVNSDPSRLEEIKKLLKTHPRLIIFYSFDYELEILRTLADPESQTWRTPKPASTMSSSPSSRKTSNSSSNAPAAIQTSPNSRSGSGRTTNTTKNTTSGSTFQVAEYNGHKHQDIPETDSWVYLVQYTAGAEGWNCTDTDATIFYSLQYSYKTFEQAHGRIDRMSTTFTDLFYYVFKSSSIVDRAIFGSLAHKKDFNEKRFARHLD